MQPGFTLLLLLLVTLVVARAGSLGSGDSGHGGNDDGTIPEFVYPKSGMNFTINTSQNVTWTLDAYPAVTDLFVTMEFGSKLVEGFMKHSELKDDLETCFAKNTFGESIPLDMTIPVDPIQQFIDEIGLPFDVDVQTIVDHTLTQLNELTDEQRNLTISLYECGADAPLFRSWVLVSSSRSVMVGAAALLAAVMFLV